MDGTFRKSRAGKRGRALPAHLIEVSRTIFGAIGLMCIVSLSSFGDDPRFDVRIEYKSGKPPEQLTGCYMTFIAPTGYILQNSLRPYAIFGDKFDSYSLRTDKLPLTVHGFTPPPRYIEKTYPSSELNLHDDMPVFYVSVALGDIDRIDFWDDGSLLVALSDRTLLPASVRKNTVRDLPLVPTVCGVPFPLIRRMTIKKAVLPTYP